MKHYELKITQHIATRPQESAYSSWDKEDFVCTTIEGILNRLDEIYGWEGGYNFIKGNEIYRDNDEGAQHIGYHFSYWTDIGDRSTGPKKGWATDWIIILEVEDKPATEILMPTKQKKTT